MYPPIMHPACPGSFALPHGLTAGQQISFHGEVKHKHKDFSINLLFGGDHALHVNFRFDHDKVVVMNSKLANAWGSEIRHANPLHHDHHFDLQIRVYPGYYHITVNGVLLADYPHRTPYQGVQAISLDGHVKIDGITFESFHF